MGGRSDVSIAENIQFYNFMFSTVQSSRHEQSYTATPYSSKQDTGRSSQPIRILSPISVPIDSSSMELDESSFPNNTIQRYTCVGFSSILYR